MSENLFVRLNHVDGEDAEVDWMLLDEVSGVARLRGRDPLSALSALLAEEEWSGRVIGLVPGEDVLITSASVPSRKQHQIMQALPFVVEERLAEDVEGMHFATGERLGKGDIVVAAVKRERIEGWVECLQSAALAPQVLVPDSLCVPLEGEEAAILIDGERALVRPSRMQGYAVERVLLGTLLQLEESAGDIAPGEERRVRLLVDSDMEAELKLEITQWQAELEGRLVTEPADYPPFETLCRGYTPDLPNLMQGEFKAQELQRESRVGWGLVAMVAGACLVLHFLLVGGKGFYLAMEAAKFEREAETLYKEVFPNDRNVRDIRRRWGAHLSGSGDAPQQGGFLPVLREAGKTLRDSGVEVDSINFNQRGELILQVRAGSSDQLVAYSQRLTQVGLVGQIGAINQGDQGVNGSVKISQGGGR